MTSFALRSLFVTARRGLSVAGLGLVLGLAVSACGSDSESSGSGGGGSGGAGGQGTGGNVTADPWDKPVCANPDVPASGVPMARADTAGVLDATGGTFLLFGGDTDIIVCGQPPARTHVNDTWLLDTACGQWTELNPAVRPPERARHSMVFDEARNRVLMFGGRTRAGGSGPYTLFNDVWAFDFASNEWSEIGATGTAPSARSNTAAVLVDDQLVVFGGNTSTSGLNFTPLNDTHVLNLATNEWQELATTNPPSSRLFHSMAYDADTGRVYVAAGGDENAFVGPFFADLWALDMGTLAWHEIPTTGLSSADQQRIKGGMAVRTAGEQTGPALFTFGGHDNTSYADVRNDVRMIDLSTLPSLPAPSTVTWTTPNEGDVYLMPAAGICDLPPDYVVPDLAAPERRQGFAMGQLPNGGAFLVFGGDSDCGRLSDAWWFNTNTGLWTPVREALAGLTCPRTGNLSCQSLCF
jgi:Galactose oxidase, central domain